MLTVLSLSSSFGTTITVTNSGFSFSPSSLAINLGDTVNFVLESSHNAVEVSQATWNANGNTSNGGFSTPFGGGKVIPTLAGTYYYVCSPHATFGMKGTIIVNNSTEVKEDKTGRELSFILNQNYPNPFNPATTISFSLNENAIVSLKLYNTHGQEVTTLIDNIILDIGNQTVKLDARGLSSGIYFYRLTVSGISREAGVSKNIFTEQRKMILIK